ncbi:hypothetical protein PFISCL1PPCAC_27097 [Pristionchus fissidentatus]|uniref:Doublecortin domain-containing protein n=1 Tax=Pristionchus fissidentatus TaxID=1538716 RepID=A0AAV5WYU9_9BILA|nr:hypothetical protein PFISCL1PPCAC_27097 [Pristionchus fissidentatus]
MIQFENIARTINRPHFLFETESEKVLFSLSQDFNSLCSRNLYTENRISNERRYQQSLPISSTKLPFTAKYVEDETDGKIYLYEETKKNECVKVWRVSCDSKQMEYTMIPPGFITRISKTEYFMLASSRKGTRASIYEWKSEQEATEIGKINLPSNLWEYTRIGHKSRIVFIKTEENAILFTCLDLITGDLSERKFILDSVIDEKRMRWFCAKYFLISVISGNLILIDLITYTLITETTNLEPEAKHHPFAVDVEGFVYVLTSSTISSVSRAKQIRLSRGQDYLITFPIVGKAAQAARHKSIHIQFRIAYKERTLFNGNITMLTTERIEDAIRKSLGPNLPAYNLSARFQDKEISVKRTPAFLKMNEGDIIFAVVTDKHQITALPLEQKDIIEGQVRCQESTDDTSTNLRDEPSEIAPTRLEKPVPKPRTVHIDSSKNGAPTVNVKIPIAGNDENPSATIEKLLNEMKWLREFIEQKEKVATSEEQLTLLQKKYARALLIIGRIHVPK